MIADEIREAIQRRVENEVAVELAREQRKATFAADPEWSRLNAEISVLFTQQDAIEKRLSASMCDLFGGHVYDNEFFPGHYCIRCYQERS